LLKPLFFAITVLVMKTLFLQFREDKVVAQHEQKCFLKHINLKVQSRNIFMDEFDFLGKNDFTHIILGGSGEFSISDKNKKSKYWKKVEKIIPFLEREIKNNTNILGVCLGHQLLAFLLGSEVKSLLNQKEVGTFRIYLTLEGKKDPLFYNLPKSFLVQEGHKDSVLKLPKEATLLAKGKKCKIQSFRFKKAAGIQFHPELEIEDINFRLSLYPDYAKKNKQPKIKETPFAFKIFENFYGI